MYKDVNGGLYFDDEDDYKKQYINLQVMYSPIKHLGISFHQTRSGFSSIGNFFNPRIFDYNSHQTGFDIGGYTASHYKSNRLRKKTGLNSKPNRTILFDCYAGFLIGQLRREDVTANILPFGPITLHSRKVYLQGGVHSIAPLMHVSIMLRTGKINYYKATLNGQIDQIEFEKIDNLLRKQTFSFYGFSIKAEFHYKSVGFYLESVQDYFDIYEDRYDNISSNVNIGVSFNINQIRKHYLSKKNKS